MVDPLTIIGVICHLSKRCAEIANQLSKFADDRSFAVKGIESFVLNLYTFSGLIELAEVQLGQHFKKSS